MATLPSNLPAYRLIVDKDNAALCERVSEALAQGYELHGSPAVTYDASERRLIVVQALVWPDRAGRQSSGDVPTYPL